MNCPECKTEVNVVCSNQNCNCRRGVSEKNMLIWTEDGNHQKCPSCGIIKGCGFWEDLSYQDYKLTALEGDISDKK